jgi:two-component system cell cycle sensor histidine kinase/response regulator CckA
MLDRLAQFLRGSSAKAGKIRPILVVDDEAPLRSVVVEMLQAHGYSALPAESGAAALALWEQRKDEIGLLLTDVMMPGMDGISLAKTIRRQAPKLPVILLSGRINEDSQWVADEAGLLLLQKPIRTDDLMRAVANYLGRPTGRKA